MTDLQFLARLETLIQQRISAAPEGSYTAKLAASGTIGCAQKVGEEGVELALAAVAEDDENVVGETADLFYHVLVLLALRGIPVARVIETLETRHATRTAK
jgi:phosphoribosyl-ATP pyrophosphohydrolase/phosphoribosyl-AMP cyclohydrolase